MNYDPAQLLSSLHCSFYILHFQMSYPHLTWIYQKDERTLDGDRLSRKFKFKLKCLPPVKCSVCRYFHHFKKNTGCTAAVTDVYSVSMDNFSRLDGIPHYVPLIPSEKPAMSRSCPRYLRVVKCTVSDWQRGTILCSSHAVPFPKVTTFRTGGDRNKRRAHTR
jgi:predicted nucleic-acid-binding Zn-ribbon protein